MLTTGWLLDKLCRLQGVERVNVYGLQPTHEAKGKHHNDQRAPKMVLPEKVTHMMHPASDMEGEQT